MRTLGWFGLVLGLGACGDKDGDDAVLETGTTIEGDADTDTDTDSDADTDPTPTTSTTPTTPTTPTTSTTPTTPTAGFAVELAGSAFDPHEGQTLVVAVHQAMGFAFVAGDFAPVTGGQFAFAFPGVLVGGQGYFVDYFVDVNGDNRCNGADLMWHLVVPPVTADVVIADVYDPATIDIQACAAF